MSIIAILISLALEKFLPAIEPMRELKWFDSFSDGLRQRLDAYTLLRGIPALLVTILLPLILVAIVNAVLDDILLFLGFLFGIVVLTYCLGPNNPLYATHRYIDAREREADDDARTALDALRPGISSDSESQSQQVVHALLVETNDRITGILFWFIVLGPIGAVLYRLSLEQALRESLQPDENNPDFSAAAIKLYALLAWIPARLTALAYAVMGSFTHALKMWQPGTGQTPVTEESEVSAFRRIEDTSSQQLLLQVGLGALQHEEDKHFELHTVREAFGLCSRSLIAWLTILGLLTLAGWIA